MKRLLMVLTVLLAMTFPARAEIVGRVGDDYIHQWTAPNGQPLYFVSGEEEPFVHMEDVNFDGAEDVVAVTFCGASNFGAEFFVWDGGGYVPVAHPGADSLVNFTLYPELGLVETYVQEGKAGALHTRQLWRWKGAELELVRRATGSEVEAWNFEGDFIIAVTDTGRLRLRVWDHLNLETADGVTGPSLLLDNTIALEDDENAQAALEEEIRVFWQGLR